MILKNYHINIKLIFFVLFLVFKKKTARVRGYLKLPEVFSDELDPCVLSFTVLESPVIDFHGFFLFYFFICFFWLIFYVFWDVVFWDVVFLSLFLSFFFIFCLFLLF